MSIERAARRLRCVVGAARSRHYHLEGPAVAGWALVWWVDPHTGKRSRRWLSMRGRSALRYTPPAYWRAAQDVLTPDEHEQLRAEWLAPITNTKTRG